MSLSQKIVKRWIDSGSRITGKLRGHHRFNQSVVQCDNIGDNLQQLLDMPVAGNGL